jgi:multimeric flavodoxin WrbA
VCVKASRPVGPSVYAVRVQELLIVYHTQSGNTGRLAQAVERGARRRTDLEVRCQRAFDTSLADLLRCSALVFASAEYNGYMSGALKDLFDRTYEQARGLVTNKPYAIVISAGNDGSFAAQYIERHARGYMLKPVAEPIIVVGAVTPQAETECEELGEALAEGLGLGIF